MSRKLAGLGLSMALAALAVALLPPLGILLAAAVCVVLIPMTRRTAVFWPVLGAALGCVWFILYSVVVVEPVQRLAGRTADCRAVVETDCVYNYTGERMRGTLLVEELDEKPVHFRVLCQDIPASSVGERFTASMTFELLEQDSYRLTRLGRGVLLQASAEQGVNAGMSQAPRFFFCELRSALSRRLRLWLPDSLGGVAAAMLLGDRSALKTPDADAFRAAGVSHLLAVSGLHVGLVCGLLFSRRRRFYRPAILMQAGVLVGYMLLTGCAVSVRRAGLVFLIALLGNFLLQPFDLLTATGAAAALLCLVNPYAPCDVSFQLSFGAVLGVQAAAQMSQNLWERFSVPQFLRGLAETLLISAGAALATLPVLVANSMTVSGAGILCNLLVLWMMMPALVLGLAVLLLSPLPFASHAASLCLGLWLKWMLSIVRWCASLPFAKLELPRLYTLGVLALMAVTWFLLSLCKRRRWFLPLAAVMTAASVAGFVYLQKDAVRIELVGSAGNPCAVITQNGQTAVIFRGGASNLKAVSRLLETRGDGVPALLVDIREDPKELDFPDTVLFTVEQQPAYGKQTILTDLTMEWYNTGNANLVVMTAQNSSFGFMAGNIRLKEPRSVDVFFAAGALSESVSAGSIVTTSKSPSWLAKAGSGPVYYGTEPVVLLRKSGSIRLEEVSQLAVQ